MSKTLQEMIDDSLADFKREAEMWRKIGAESEKTKEYYIGLLDEIAKVFGKRSYRSDDGSMQEDPLRAKMPDLVRNLEQERQYHMNAINHLAIECGLDATTSEAIVLDTIKTIKNLQERIKMLERIA